MQRWIYALAVCCGACASSQSHSSGNTNDTKVAFSAFSCGVAESEDDFRSALAERATELALRSDYDALRIAAVHANGDRSPQAELGELCSGATDKAACSARVATLEGAITDVPGPHRYKYAGRLYAVTTRGDDVVMHTTPSEVSALLGPIDNPFKAWVITQVADGIGPHTCDPGYSGYRFVKAGIELRHVETMCG